MKLNKDLVVKDNALNQYTFYKSSVQLKIFAQIICDIRKAPQEQFYTIEISEQNTEEIVQKFFEFLSNKNTNIKKFE